MARLMFLSPVHTTARYLPGSPRARYKAAMASKTCEKEAEVEDTKEPKAPEKEDQESEEKEDAEEVPVLKKPASKAQAAAKKQDAETKDTIKEPKEAFCKS